jgi:hypothetical protein
VADRPVADALVDSLGGRGVDAADEAGPGTRD